VGPPKNHLKRGGFFYFTAGLAERVAGEGFQKILGVHLKLNKLPNTELMNLTNLYRFGIRIVI
jgi:hypothetical protein